MSVLEVCVEGSMSEVRVGSLFWEACIGVCVGVLCWEDLFWEPVFGVHGGGSLLWFLCWGLFWESLVLC